MKGQGTKENKKKDIDICIESMSESD